MKKEDRKKICGKLLAAIGIGSFLACCLIGLSQSGLVPLSEELESAVMSGKIQNMGNVLLQGVISVIGVFALLISPLLVCQGKKAGAKIFVLFSVFFIDAVGGLVVATSGQVTWFYILVIWLSSIYIVWFCGELAEIIYLWVKTEVEGNRENVVRLAFIWTVLAFILGKVW